MLNGRRPAVWAVLALLAGAIAGCNADVPELIDAARMGRVRVYRVAEKPRGFVYVFSDESGWTPALDAAAREIAARGAVVLGVDLPDYQRWLAASDDGCHYVIAEMEDASRDLQREYGFDGYHSPILAGIGAGGTLAYAGLAQSPAATIEGAVSVDPAPDLRTRVPLCPGAPSSRARDGGFRYGPHADLPGWWVVSPRDSVPRELAKLAKRAPRVKGSAEERLAALVVARLSEMATPSADRAMASLPLVEVRAKTPAPLMAIIYSGDGGWRDLDKQIAGVLAKDGVPVVGVDCLRYFWRARTPDEVAADLSAILRHYRARWGAHEVVVIGYSFGAGILPFAYNRLPESERASIVQLSLLGFSDPVPFQIGIEEWLGFVSSGSLPVLPEVAKLDLSRVQCFYGADEEDTVCPSDDMRGAELIGTTGGHHFDGDYAALAKKILEGARRRATGSATSPRRR